MSPLGVITHGLRAVPAVNAEVASCRLRLASNLPIHLFARLMSSLEAFAATCFYLLIAASRVFFSSPANALEIPKSNSVSLRIDSLFRTIMPLAKRSSRAFLPTFYRNVKNFSSVAPRFVRNFFSAHTLARFHTSRSRISRNALVCCVASSSSLAIARHASHAHVASSHAAQSLRRAPLRRASAPVALQLVGSRIRAATRSHAQYNHTVDPSRSLPAGCGCVRSMPKNARFSGENVRSRHHRAKDPRA